jgi:Mn-dependent DtxR family transcriptional regulator
MPINHCVNNPSFILLTIKLAFLVLSTMPAKKTSQSALGSSAAVEDYLERILELINAKGYARVVDIAAALKISQASVTNMVQRLDAGGLLKYEKYRGLILTAAGKNLARKIAHRHKLLTDFLTLLGLDERIIYHDVEGMEHHISAPTLRAIEALTAQLRRRPALRAQLEAAVV